MKRSQTIVCYNYLSYFRLSHVTDDPTFEERQLAWQFGSQVTQIQPHRVLKQGSKVMPLESTAMRLVKEYLPGVPVPSIIATKYRYKQGIPVYGELEMEYMPGTTLKSIWINLSNETKERVCGDIWNMVARIRTVPLPADLRPGHYRTTDGSSSYDPFLGDENDLAPIELDDDTLRGRIYSRYVATNGLSYKDSGDIIESLPRSNVSVFTHGDIGPRNIIVDGSYCITGLLDWEYSGWFPDYWEYAMMMRFCSEDEQDWQTWMERSKPTAWDITALGKVRRVLF